MHDQVVEEAGTRSIKKTLFLTESPPQISTLERRPKKLGFDGRRYRGFLCCRSQLGRLDPSKLTGLDPLNALR
jgi:hypothetical protein